jgi:SAM-dependent methyltransferase
MNRSSKPFGKAVRDAIFTAVRYSWSRANDAYLNIDTSDEAHFDEFDRRKGFPFAPAHDDAKHQDSIIYQGANYWNLRRIVRVLKPGGKDVFYDIGCGKGRCLCMLARLPIRRVVGIELDARLVEAARSNAKRLRGKRAPIEVRCQDAAMADYSEGTMYLLYCPFGPDTMHDVLEKIRQSVLENPRKITVVYYHAMFGEVLRSCAWLEQVCELQTLVSRYPISFFVNRAVA